MTGPARPLVALALLACAAAHGCAAGSAAPRGAGQSPDTVAAALGQSPAIPVMDGAGHERLGDWHAGQRSFERAYLEYREALRREPGRPSARYKAARVLLRRGLVREAREEFAAIVADRPDDALALLGLGHAALLAGDQGTEQLLRGALARDASLWQAHNLLGLHYAREGLHAKAISEFYAALRLNPAEDSVANNLGVSLLQTGRLETAELAFRHALASGSRDPKVTNNLGVTLVRLGRRDEAIEAFSKGGTRAAAWNNLGFALLLEGKTEEALGAFGKAIESESGYFRRAHDNIRRALGARPAPPPQLPTAP